MRSGGGLRVGFFGKLPSRGDFVRAGLSRDFTGCWDAWLQAVMPAVTTLGDAAADRWTAAPPWRFALSAGVCGARPAAGVWLASTDAVGRAFPLVVAAEAASPSAAFFDAIEPIAIGAVRTNASPDALATRLDHLPCPEPASRDGTQGARWWTGANAAPIRQFGGTALPDAACFLRMLEP